ncbi:hypothetical protein [Magnetospira sp. QH-2]|uniref:hypothetical protein n=1 Tax=Magnetospira sp. (strain QH-2) TaxID=1288970 RepID=UPI0003E80D2B|nr:hypothetical protein [Magnetospira sp. QH-2]CCQ75244.1 exported protein of unknown function [Magnetospira sp. QH-2]
MHIPYFLGLLLCGLAVLLAGIETMSRMRPEIGGVLIATTDLWRALDPDTFIAFRQAIPRGIWVDVVAPLFQAPVWLLVGGPGLILAWVFRSKSPEDLAELEESLFLFDRLAEEAEQGAHDPPADIAEAPGSDEPMLLTEADRVEPKDPADKI